MNGFELTVADRQAKQAATILESSVAKRVNGVVVQSQMSETTEILEPGAVDLSQMVRFQVKTL